MKTKKISWQAIAIVVLALVLIASIALGVSGAWFQDSDDLTSEGQLGNPVTVRLSGTVTDGTKPDTWDKVYKAERAYPGDKILGETKVLLGYDTKAVVRVKISAKIYESDGSEITTENVATKAAASTVPTYYDKGSDAWIQEYKDSFAALNTIMESATVDTTKWSTSTDGWFYYNVLANNETKTDAMNGLYLFNELNIPLTVTNAANNWKIEVKVDAEAVQAANLKDGQVPTDWDYSTIPSTVQSAISDYNDERTK